MPPPNKAKHKQVTKAYAKARLDEGATYREIAEETGVSLGTLSNWKGQIEQTPQELERGKKVLNLLDYDNLAKASYIITGLLEEIIERIKNKELKEEDLKTLSRAGVELSKIYGIITDKTILREGGIVPGHQPPSVAALLAAYLAKASADTAAAKRIEAETKAYEATYKEKPAIDVTPSS